MLTSDFEIGLLQSLRKKIPDLVAEFPIQGKGKAWVANLYSDSRKLVIEASSRKVKRTGRSGGSIQHIEKFYSMLLKLIDMKSANPEILPVMIWSDLVPAYSRDLQMASKWGIYILSNRSLVLDDIWTKSPEAVNQDTLSHLIRRSTDGKPRWHWIWEEQRNLIEQTLRERASTTNRLVHDLGLELTTSSRTKVRGIVGKLVKQGKVKRLLPGHIAGEGAVYGTDQAQLAGIEGSLFDKYKGEKRRLRLCHYMLLTLKDEEGLNAKEVRQRLYKKWRIDASAAEVSSLLSRRLPKEKAVYADHASAKTRYFLQDWWDEAHRA
jgi:hypothetical protein